MYYIVRSKSTRILSLGAFSLCITLYFIVILCLFVQFAIKQVDKIYKSHSCVFTQLSNVIFRTFSNDIMAKWRKCDFFLLRIYALELMCNCVTMCM